MRRNVLSNQKGFTLIELLAVITILAIIMLLAAQSVTTALTNAQRRSFIIDSERIVEAAKLAYTDALLNNQTKNANQFCMSIAYLKNHGLEKNDDVTGSILVDVTNATAKYKIFLDNGQFLIDGVYMDALSVDSLKPGGTTASSTCGGTGTTLTN